MSTHYLIDANTNPIADSDINDVRLNVTTSPVQGNFVVRVADGVELESEPTDLTDLLTKKYAALLAYYPGFNDIYYEDMVLTPPSVDFAQDTEGLQVGERGTTCFNPDGVFRSNVVALGATPSEVFPLIELGQMNVSNSSLLTREYVESAASAVTFELSFDNGVNFSTVTHGSLFNIPVLEQGNQLIVRITNLASSSKYWLSSWAIVI